MALGQFRLKTINRRLSAASIFDYLIRQKPRREMRCLKLPSSAEHRGRWGMRVFPSIHWKHCIHPIVSISVGTLLRLPSLHGTRLGLLSDALVGGWQPEQDPGGAHSSQPG